MLQLPAGREASREGGSGGYERHRPERTLLYPLVEERYPAFKRQWATEGRVLPDDVQREFEAYLRCGRLEHGFMRVRCDRRHVERLVDAVFPSQPVRQWVLSFPYLLRFLFASRPVIMGRVLGIVYRAIATHLIKKAGFTKKTAHTGAVR